MWSVSEIITVICYLLTYLIVLSAGRTVITDRGLNRLFRFPQTVAAPRSTKSPVLSHVPGRTGRILAELKEKKPARRSDRRPPAPVFLPAQQEALAGKSYHAVPL